MSSNKKSIGALGASSALAALFIALLATTPSQAAAGDTVRVNCGGDAYTDALGHVWAADSGSSGGTAYSVTGTEVMGTTDQGLWQYESYGNTDEAPFFYNFNMPAGSYTVKLYLAEIYDGWCSEGGRVFNVDINGNPVLTDYDIYAVAGCSTALIKSFGVTTTDGKIKINFTNVGSGHPKVNAIEIVPGLPASLSGKILGNPSKLAISSSGSRLSVQTQTEGAYTLELSNLQGKRITQKRGFGSGVQSFANLNPGLYFLTSRIGSQVDTRKVSVVP